MAIELPGITVRPAQEGDLPQIVNLGRLAFMPTGSLSDIQSTWYAGGVNPPGRQMFMAVDSLTETAIGTYAQLDLQLSLEGHLFPVRGVSSVAVAPERRGQQVARLLLEQGLELWRSQQIPLAMLYPFQHGFYRRLGWAWVGRAYQYAVATRHIPAYTERFGMVAYDPEQHLTALQDTYQRSALRHNGWLQRQALQWEYRLKSQPGREIYCYLEAGKLLGYVILQFTHLESPQRSLIVSVQEWVALNADAYRGILGFLAGLRDQVSLVVWNTYFEDPFPHLLKEQQQATLLNQTNLQFGLTHRFGEISSSFMWRLVDVQTAFRLRPISPGSPFILTFEIHDPVLGEQTITANFAAGRMHPVTSPGPAVVKLSIEHLTELFCGVRRITELVWTREVEYQGDRALLPKLDAAWQCTPPFCWDFF